MMNQNHTLQYCTKLNVATESKFSSQNNPEELKYKP